MSKQLRNKVDYDGARAELVEAVRVALYRPVTEMINRAPSSTTEESFRKGLLESIVLPLWNALEKVERQLPKTGPDDLKHRIDILVGLYCDQTVQAVDDESWKVRGQAL